MKAITLNNRLLKSNVNKTSVAYKIIKELIGLYGNKTYHIFGDIIRPCYTSGSGRFTSNQDHTDAVCNLLDELKVKYEFGNDAPRGSATGNWIKILTNIEH